MGNGPQCGRVIERTAIDRDVFLRVRALAPKDGEAMRASVDDSLSSAGLCSLVGPGLSLSDGHAAIRYPQGKNKTRTCDRLTIGTVAGEQGYWLYDNFVADVSADTASRRVF